MIENVLSIQAAPGEITVAVYTFSHEKGEPMPYRVKIPSKSVSLRHVKDFLPKKGAFRCYILLLQFCYKFPPSEEA